MKKYTESIPIYKMIDSRNIEKLKKIYAKTIQDGLFYKKGDQAHGHWRLKDKITYRKWLLDTMSWIITKLDDLWERNKINTYLWRKNQIKA